MSDKNREVITPGKLPGVPPAPKKSGKSPAKRAPRPTAKELKRETMAQVALSWRIVIASGSKFGLAEFDRYTEDLLKAAV